MTNAHVVAGTQHVDVYLADSVRSYPATVVVFDPETDVAVLAVPDLTAPALRLGPELRRGDDAVVAGFPGDGPLQATAARVRGRIRAVGEDIYGAGSVERDVYALRAEVRSGNSGGPLLDPQGRVVGLVFAASVDDPSTGYALTPDEVRPALDASRTTSVRGAHRGLHRLTCLDHPRLSRKSTTSWVTTSGASSCTKWPTPSSRRHRCGPSR